MSIQCIQYIGPQFHTKTPCDICEDDRAARITIAVTAARQAYKVDRWEYLGQQKDRHPYFPERDEAKVWTYWNSFGAAHIKIAERETDFGTESLIRCYYPHDPDSLQETLHSINRYLCQEHADDFFAHILEHPFVRYQRAFNHPSRVRSRISSRE